MNNPKSTSQSFQLALIGALAAGLVFAGGCRRGGPDAGVDGQPRVALVVKTLNSPFFLDMRRGAEAAARELGIHKTTLYRKMRKLEG